MRKNTQSPARCQWRLGQWQVFCPDNAVEPVSRQDMGASKKRI